MLRTLTIATILSFLIGASAHAELYKRVDENGKVTYEDKPSGQAKPVEPGGLTTYSPPTQHTQTAPAKPTPEKSKPSGITHYSVLSIASPSADATVRDNVGNMAVKINVSPALDVKSGHKLVVLLDKKSVANTPAPEAALNAVERGTHTLAVQITDDTGRVLKQSAEVTFHMQRFIVPQAKKGGK